MSAKENGTWFAETIRASGNYPAINRPDTRPYQTKACRNVKKPLQRRSHPHKTLGIDDRHWITSLRGRTRCGRGF